MFCGAQWCYITYSLLLRGFFKNLILLYQILISQILKYLAFFGQKMANFVSIQEKGETSLIGIILDHRVQIWGYLSLNPGEYWPFGPFFKFLNTVHCDVGNMMRSTLFLLCHLMGPTIMTEGGSTNIVVKHFMFESQNLHFQHTIK